MASPDRFQLDDHFAASKARSQARPAGTIGTGRALAGVVLLGAAIAATWWWALQPAAAGAVGDAHPLPVTVAQRQAAVAGELDESERGPIQGGETDAEYNARMARLRARLGAAGGDQGPDAPTGRGAADRAAAGSLAAAAGGSDGGSAAARAGGAGTPALPAKPAALTAPDSTAGLLARRVNEHRQSRATHLRWLDACAKQHLVENARAAIANARDANASRSAMISANNLAADIDTHQREARRIDDILGVAEHRLVDYCASHGQTVPALDNPPTTVDGILAQPRPMPVAATTARPAAGAAQRQGFVDPFQAPER